MSRTSSRALLALTLIMIAGGLLVLNLGGYLQAEVARLQREVISLREQANEAEVLAGLLGYARSRPESSYVAARVIGQDISPFIRSIWIGQGSDQGLQQGMPVVTERGLVGRVAEVYPTVARVQLITDPESVVNVRLQASRADGTLRARVNGELWVDLIEQEASVTPGELVLSSGLGGAFPEDIPIGQVVTVRKRDYELFQQAVVQPSADLENLEIVLVIANFRPLSQPGAAGAP